MVLIGGDPSRRISDIRNVRLIMKDGAIADPAKLLALAGVEADTEPGPGVKCGSWK